MFELHELLPYIFSIGLIFTVSYAYIAHLHCGMTEYWIGDRAGGGLDPILPALSLHSQYRREDLSRMVRRREAPDEDEPDCVSSLIERRTNQRGGYIYGSTIKQGIHFYIGQGTDVWADCDFVRSYVIGRM